MVSDDEDRDGEGDEGLYGEGRAGNLVAGGDQLVLCPLTGKDGDQPQPRLRPGRDSRSARLRCHRDGTGVHQLRRSAAAARSHAGDRGPEGAHRSPCRYGLLARHRGRPRVHSSSGGPRAVVGGPQRSTRAGAGDPCPRPHRAADLNGGRPRSAASPAARLQEADRAHLGLTDRRRDRWGAGRSARPRRLGAGAPAGRHVGGAGGRSLDGLQLAPPLPGGRCGSPPALVLLHPGSHLESRTVPRQPSRHPAHRSVLRAGHRWPVPPRPATHRDSR